MKELTRWMRPGTAFQPPQNSTCADTEGKKPGLVQGTQVVFGGYGRGARGTREVRQMRHAGARLQRTYVCYNPTSPWPSESLQFWINHVTRFALWMLADVRREKAPTVLPRLGLCSCPPAFCHENMLSAITDPRRMR